MHFLAHRKGDDAVDLSLNASSSRTYFMLIQDFKLSMFGLSNFLGEFYSTLIGIMNH